MLKKINGRDYAEKIYILVTLVIRRILTLIVPYIRRLQRFIFLPYCYLYLVNWNICKSSKIKVAKDFLYIFFVLKSFPDNYFPCRLWEKDRKEWAKYWGSNYNPWQRYRLSKDIQKPRYEILYEDKNVCYDLCQGKGIAIPKNIKTVIPYCSKLSAVTDAFSNNSTVESLIVKPLGGKGGHNISVFHRESQGSPAYSSGQFEDVSDGYYVIQEFINQHEQISQFSNSVNTVRCVTLLTPENDVLILGAYIRFGVGNSLIDNLSKGGVAVEINLEDGSIADYGIDRKGVYHYVHPSSKKQFSGFFIPEWSALIDFSKQVQWDISYYKLLGMDIAISKEGPILVEINAIYDHIDLEQVCGPIFSNKKVLSSFNQYNLLFNRSQKLLVENI